ncbi:COG4280 domain-containing protein [Microlunatus elymi]|uniref:COG4280 domain-containing protein n=1 Tax=Microlunatus elymi TaxID=2596828 RepID=UPI001D18AE46|nr:TMEM165/GDT1 family protein [Microlunatus elymi]
MTAVALFVAVFLACIVESVEATTIVVAVGATRNWRSALTGTVVALIALAAIVAVAGPAIMLLPLGILRLVVGALLLVFGLQWLRKAALRASGFKALHDEDLIYRKQVAAAAAAEREHRFGVSDWYAFTLAFKGVLLEGLEVVFIVLTFATNEGNLPVAVLAAVAAAVIVVILGAVIRGPLSRVPENTLKFVVGIMLTTFGVYWGAEGAGAVWPGADVALLLIAPAVAGYCLLLVAVLVRLRRRRLVADSAKTQAAATAGRDRQLPDNTGTAEAPASTEPATATHTGTAPDVVVVPTVRHRLKAFGLFWYDFVIGDDWQVAVGVLVMLAAIALAHTASAAWLIAPAGLAILIPYGTLRAARS